MKLPVRILLDPEVSPEDPGEPLLSVDGAWGAPGLNLSHWPGNKTPYALKHDLSTGCVLNWARLGQVEREAMARGCVAIANNHYDTDGICALFAARYPEEALERSGALIDAARAGDFYQMPTERAFAFDALVSNLGVPGRSPLGARIEGLERGERYQAQTEFLLRELPALLDAKTLPYPELWKPELEDARADREDLKDCERQEDEELDLVVWTAPRGRRSSRPLSLIHI